MKRFCFLAVLMALSSSAYAGRSISFSVGRHRVHIESSRHCRSLSCASVSISKRLNWRRKRDRYEEERDATVPAKPVPSVPQTVSPPAPPPTTRRRPRPSFPRRRPSTRRPHRGAIPSCASASLRHRFKTFQYQCRRRHRSQNRSRPRSPRRRSSASRIRPRKKRRRILRSATGRPKARERCGSENAAMRCAASCSVHRTKGRSDPDQHEAEDGKAMDRRRLQPGLWRDVLRHDVDEGDQHASRRSLRARPLLLLGQQLEPHHAPRRRHGDVAADVAELRVMVNENAR